MPCLPAKKKRGVTHIHISDMHPSLMAPCEPAPDSFFESSFKANIKFWLQLKHSAIRKTCDRSSVILKKHVRTTTY